MNMIENTSTETREQRPAKNHVVRCWTTFFPSVWSGSKPFEVRRNDRDYREGDTIEFQEYDAITQSYTGRVAYRTVTYVLTHGAFPDGLAFGYAVLGLHIIANDPTGCTPGEREE